MHRMPSSWRERMRSIGSSKVLVGKTTLNPPKQRRDGQGIEIFEIVTPIISVFQRPSDKRILFQRRFKIVCQIKGILVIRRWVSICYSIRAKHIRNCNNANRCRILNRLTHIFFSCRCPVRQTLHRNRISCEQRIHSKNFFLRV